MASGGQPTWSPDGTQIAYVSDTTRHPQIYVVDVATKAKRRLTSKGSQNVDPDWGADGRITYITKRGGLAQVAVMDPKAGEQSAKLVTSPGSWEHPVWSRDGRHLVAGRDKALFVVDSVEKEDGGDEPRQLFRAAGNWITPTWIR
jgi:TolB protein